MSIPPLTPLKLHELCCDQDIDPDLVALLGILSVNFNYAERLLRIFLEEYLHVDEETSAQIACSMANNAVINLCRTLIESREHEPEVKLASEAYIDNFDVIAENRNVAMHALVYGTKKEGFTFSKRTKKGALQHITILQHELELCCKELKQLFHFGCTIKARFDSRREGRRPVKLLPTPSEPRKLHSRQLSPNTNQSPPSAS